MKRVVYLVIIVSAVLSTMVFAQQYNRVLSKGYALFSKDG
jgi:hypothetical protein